MISFEKALQGAARLLQSSFGRTRPPAVTLVVLVCSLTACATLPNPRGGATASVAVAGQAAFFALKGRISVRVGQRLETGSVAWTRAEKEERLEIFTPFGSQIAEIVKNASAGVVMRKGGESVQADSVGELTSDVLGVALDLDMIAAWTQGVGLVDGLAQSLSLPNGDTWHVTAERFQASGANRFVSRLTATRGDTVVRLVIDEWQPR